MLNVTNRPFMLSVFRLNVVMLSVSWRLFLIPIQGGHKLGLDPSNVNKTQIREH